MSFCCSESRVWRGDKTVLTIIAAASLLTFCSRDVIIPQFRTQVEQRFLKYNQWKKIGVNANGEYKPLFLVGDTPRGISTGYHDIKMRKSGLSTLTARHPLNTDVENFYTLDLLSGGSMEFDVEVSNVGCDSYVSLALSRRFPNGSALLKHANEFREHCDFFNNTYLCPEIELMRANRYGFQVSIPRNGRVNSSICDDDQLEESNRETISTSSTGARVFGPGEWNIINSNEFFHVRVENIGQKQTSIRLIQHGQRPYTATLPMLISNCDPLRFHNSWSFPEMGLFGDFDLVLKVRDSPKNVTSSCKGSRRKGEGIMLKRWLRSAATIRNMQFKTNEPTLREF